MNINSRRLIAGAISALVLVAFATPLVSPAQAEMTPEQASAYYLTQECRNSVALFLFIDEVTRHGSIVFGDVEKRFSRFKREAKRFGAAETRFATRLLSPPDLWPAPVAGAVQVVADAGLKSGEMLNRAAQASTARAWWRQFRKANSQITTIENGKTQIR